MNLTCVLVLVPAYNEGGTIGSVLVALGSAGFSKIVVIDDGSVDSTGEVALDLGVDVLRHTTNLGLGSALRTGYEYALSRRADCEYVVTVDADGQHRVEDVVSVAKTALESGLDLVNGVRDFFSSWVRFDKRVISIVASAFGFVVSGRYSKDVMSGLKCIKLSALEKLDLTARDYSIPADIMIEAVRSGLSIKEVPIAAVYTDYSLSKPSRLRIANSYKIVKGLLSVK